MAGNRAQQELQALLAARDSHVDAGESLARLQESSRPIGTVRAGDDDDEATFDTPKALATAVGAGFVLGPVGGLLLGVAQGILGKREQQSVLDQMAAERNAITDADDIFGDELDRLAMVTDNPLDLDQLNSMRANKDAAVRLMMSASPELQQRGSAMLADFNASLQAYSTQQETQAIEADVRRDEAIRAMGEETWQRFDTIQSDLTAISQPFLAQRESYGRLIASARDPSPAGDLSLIISYMKILDPASIVREGEQAQASNAAGVPERIRGIYNNLLTGEKLTPEQRADFLARGGALFKKAAGEQDDRNTRHLQRARDFGVPEKYLDTMAIPTGINSELPVPTTAEVKALLEQTSPRTAGEAVPILGAAQRAAGEVLETIAPTDPEAPPSFLERIGVLNRNERGRRTQTQRGVTYERIDYPDGRFEWVPVEQPGAGLATN